MYEPIIIGQSLKELEKEVQNLEEEVKTRTEYSDNIKEQNYVNEFRHLYNAKSNDPNLKEQINKKLIVMESNKYENIRDTFSSEDNKKFFEKIKKASPELSDKEKNIDFQLEEINKELSELNAKNTNNTNIPSLRQKAYTMVTGNENNQEKYNGYITTKQKLESIKTRIHDLKSTIKNLIPIYTDVTSSTDEPNNEGGKRKTRRNKKGKSKTRKNSKKSNRRR